MCWAAFICNANSGVSWIFMNLLLLSFYLWNPNVYITDNDWIWEWSLQWWNHLSRCENKALKKKKKKKNFTEACKGVKPMTSDWYFSSNFNWRDSHTEIWAYVIRNWDFSGINLTLTLKNLFVWCFLFWKYCLNVTTTKNNESAVSVIKLQTIPNAKLHYHLLCSTS